MVDYRFERCRVQCETCGVRYNTIEYEDEIPTICEYCHTPTLRVIEREPIEFEFAESV